MKYFLIVLSILGFVAVCSPLSPRQPPFFNLEGTFKMMTSKLRKALDLNLMAFDGHSWFDALNLKIIVPAGQKSVQQHFKLKK